MKRLFVILSIFLFIVTAEARGIKRVRKSLVEIGPKASFYIGEDVWFGIGAEVVANPRSNFGIRFNITELVFGNGTAFYLNGGDFAFSGSSLDALIYFPLTQLEPYALAGLGFWIFNPPGQGDTHTTLNFRFGMGFKFPTNPKTNLFIEPGIIVYSNGETKAMFRLSFGARFGI